MVFQGPVYFLKITIGTLQGVEINWRKVNASCELDGVW